MKETRPQGSSPEQDLSEERVEQERPETQHVPESLKEESVESDIDGGRPDVQGDDSIDSTDAGGSTGSSATEQVKEPHIETVDAFDGIEPKQTKDDNASEISSKHEPSDATNDVDTSGGTKDLEVTKKENEGEDPIVYSYSVTKEGTLGLKSASEFETPELEEESTKGDTVSIEGSSVDKPELLVPKSPVTCSNSGELVAAVEEGSSVDSQHINNVTFEIEEDTKPGLGASFSTDVSTVPEVAESHGSIKEIIQSAISKVVVDNLNTSVESATKVSETEIPLLNGETGTLISDQKPDMPEKTEQQVPLAAALQNATCRYRWAKTLPTTSSDVMFFCSVKMEQPVKLSWTEGSECYYSEEFEVPTGVYKGNLVVNGKTYPVEDLTIKHYTFEVDLYVRDAMDKDRLPDIIDDDIEAETLTDRDGTSTNLTNTYGDIPSERLAENKEDPVFQISNKYEELIRQQLTMSQSIDNLEREAALTAKAIQQVDEFSSTGRQSPLGDIATEPFQDGGGRNMFDPSSPGQTNCSRANLDASVIEDEVEKSNMPPSHHSSFHGSAVDPYEIAGHQEHLTKSPVSPARQTPTDLYGGGEDRKSPVKSRESSLNGSGVPTPVHDVIGEFIADQRRTPQQQDTVVKDVLSRQLTPTNNYPLNSYHGSEKHSPTLDFVGDVLGQSTPVVTSEHSGSLQGSARQTPVNQISAHSSARQTPQPAGEMFRSSSQEVLNGAPAPGSYHGSAAGSPAPGSYHGSPAPASYHGSVTGSPAPGSYHESPAPGSYHGSPAPGSFHSSVVGSPTQGSYHESPAPGSYHGSITGSPALGSYHGSSPPVINQGSAVGSPAPGSYKGSAAGSPVSGNYHVSGVVGPGSYQGSLKGSQGQGSTHGSAAGSPAPGSFNGSIGQGSYHGSQASGSRPQSLTSEQELSQYFSDRSDRRTPTAQQHQQISSTSPAAAMVRPGSERSERSAGTTSLPVMNTQQRLQTEKRSMTPDNHIRVPGSPGMRMSPLVTGSAPRSGASSRSSTRTITPTSGANGYQINGDQEDFNTQRVRELEDTVRNLRKLLGSREMEVKELATQVSDLNEMNRSLKEELELARNRVAPGSRGNLAEWERKYNQLMDEKEILAAEVVKLRDQMEELGQTSENNEGDPGGLSSYNPNNPYALQRKIEELQSQVQDLQEANESAVTELSEVEKKCKDLQTENDKLSNLKNTSLSDLQAKNRRLHDKISTLWEQGYGDGDRKLRVEVQQFKDDNRALKERNYKLHEENLSLREEVSQIRKVLEGVSTKREENLRYRDDRLDQSENKLRYSDNRLSRTEVGKSHHGDDRLSQSERFPQQKEKVSNREDLHTTYRRTMDKDLGDRFRTTYEKEDHFRRSLEKGDGLKGSLKKDERYSSSSYRLEKDERYKNDIDKEEKYKSKFDKDDFKLHNGREMRLNGAPQYKSSDRYDPSSDRLTQYESSKDKSRSSRSYDQDFTERSRSEGYRSRPDGGSISGEKDMLVSSLNPHEKQMTPEKSSYSSRLPDTDQRDKSLKDIYSVEGQNFPSNHEYRAVTSSYSELLKLTQQSSLGDKRGEWSRSDADLHHAHARGRLEADVRVPNRGRPREPTERPHSASASRGRGTSPPPSQQNCYHHSSRPRSAHLPRPVYGWDDDHRDVGPPPPYRTKDNYDRRDVDREYPLLRKSTSLGYPDDKAEESDTGTDILVNAQPFEKQIPSPSSHRRSEPHRRHNSSHHRRFRRRRDSLGSEGSDSSPDESNQVMTTSLRRRSKSADGRELLRRSAPAGILSRSQPPVPVKSGEKPSFSKTTSLTGPAGFRTVTPGVIPTQHNKHMLSASSRESVPYMHQTYYRSDSLPPDTDNLLYDEAYIELLKIAFGLENIDTGSPGSLVTLTTGLRPFAPRTPGDINMEDVVKFSRQGGKLSQGTVKFVGHLPGRNDVYLGVELDKEEGKHDGTFENARYFKCKPNKGVFVAFNKVVMAWAP